MPVQKTVLTAAMLMMYLAAAVAQEQPAAPPVNQKQAMAEACARSVAAGIDMQAAPNERQKAAYRQCFTQFGLTPPNLGQPIVTPEIVAAFRDCVAAHGGRLPDRSSNARPLSQSDFDTIRDCSVSTGMTPAAAAAPPISVDARNRAARECIEKLFPPGTPLTPPDKMTPEQRGGFQNCLLQNNVPALPIVSDDQNKAMNDCLAGKIGTNLSVSPGHDDIATVNDCVKSAHIDLPPPPLGKPQTVP